MRTIIDDVVEGRYRHTVTQLLIDFFGGDGISRILLRVAGTYR